MSVTTNDEELITRQEAAALLRVRSGTLAIWAMTRKHLPYVKLGHKTIRYRKSDVEALIERSTLPAEEQPA